MTTTDPAARRAEIAAEHRYVVTRVLAANESEGVRMNADIANALLIDRDSTISRLTARVEELELQVDAQKASNDAKQFHYTRLWADHERANRDLAELRAANVELADEVSDTSTALGEGPYDSISKHAAAVVAAVARLTAENAELRRDAERLDAHQKGGWTVGPDTGSRWTVSVAGPTGGGDYDEIELTRENRPATLREALDAARATLHPDGATT